MPGVDAQALQRAFEKIGEQQTAPARDRGACIRPAAPPPEPPLDLIGAERRVDEAWRRRRCPRAAAPDPASSAIRGRDHDAQPGLEHSRQLKAKRLAAARRHEREHVLARQHVAHDRLLAGTKILESENAMQCCGEVGHGAAFYRTATLRTAGFAARTEKNSRSEAGGVLGGGGCSCAGRRSAPPHSPVLSVQF